MTPLEKLRNARRLSLESCISDNFFAVNAAIGQVSCKYLHGPKDTTNATRLCATTIDSISSL